MSRRSTRGTSGPCRSTERNSASSRSCTRHADELGLPLRELFSADAETVLQPGLLDGRELVQVSLTGQYRVPEHQRVHIATPRGGQRREGRAEPEADERHARHTRAAFQLTSRSVDVGLPLGAGSPSSRRLRSRRSPGNQSRAPATRSAARRARGCGTRGARADIRVPADNTAARRGRRQHRPSLGPTRCGDHRTRRSASAGGVQNAAVPRCSLFRPSIRSAIVASSLGKRKRPPAR